MKYPIKDIETLVRYLNSLAGWGIKKYGCFAVTWEDDDGYPNWCDESMSGIERRCERSTKNAIDILKILDWDKDTVKFLRNDKGERN